MIEGLLLRLLIAVLVYFLGERVIGLVGGDAAKILNIILLICVVLYVVFGSTFLR